MKTVLITGVNGFVGKHLVRDLHTRGINIIGVGYEPVVHPEISRLLASYKHCDLTDKAQVAALGTTNVAAVFSLAGLASTGKSFGDEKKYIDTNVAVFANLAEKLRRDRSKARVLAISSGAVYDATQAMPLSESSATSKASSPYAASKLAMEKSVNGFIDQGLDCVIVRPFNHIGPGQESGFLVPDLFKKLQTSIGNNTPVVMGNLSTRRDYTDVRDVVRAYCELAFKSTLSSRLYNVCSMHSVSGNDILNELIASMGNPKVDIKIDASLTRPNDPKELIGDNSRLCSAINWKPSIPLAITIKDFIKQKLLA